MAATSFLGKLQLRSGASKSASQMMIKPGRWRAVSLRKRVGVPGDGKRIAQDLARGRVESDYAHREGLGVGLHCASASRRPVLYSTGSA